MALTNTAGNTGRVTPTNNFRSDIQSLLGRQHGIQPRSHVTDSTLRFGSINCLDELFLRSLARRRKVLVGDIQRGHDGNAFGDGVLGTLGDVAHLAIDQVDGSQTAPRALPASRPRGIRGP